MRNPVPLMVMESAANVMFDPYITGRLTGLIAVMSGNPKVTALERVPTTTPEVTEILGFQDSPFANLPVTEVQELHMVVS